MKEEQRIQELKEQNARLLKEQISAIELETKEATQKIQRSKTISRRKKARLSDAEMGDMDLA